MSAIQTTTHGPAARQPALKLADAAEPTSRVDRMRAIALGVGHAALDLAVFTGVITVLYWTVKLAWP